MPLFGFMRSQMEVTHERCIVRFVLCFDYCLLLIAYCLLCIVRVTLCIVYGVVCSVVCFVLGNLNQEFKDL